MLAEPPSRSERTSLFRAEALDAQSEAVWGAPVSLMPVTWSAIGFALAVMAVTAAVFLFSQTYARKETASGVLKPSAGEARIYPTHGGTLMDLAVSEDNVVKRGDLIATVSTRQTLHGGANLDQSITATLDAEAETLRSRLAALSASSLLSEAELAGALSAVEADREAAGAAIISGKARLTLAEERFEAFQRLVEQGFGATEELRRREDAVIALRQAVSDAEGRAASLGGQILRLQAQKARLPFEAAQTREQITAALAGIEQRRSETQAGRGYEIHAPASGRVSALQARAGEALDPQRPLLTITPLDAPLVAEVYAPSRAIGFVKPGQTVRLLLDAFPYQRFGPAYGRVQAISATVLAPSEINAVIDIKEPVYRVVVALDRQSMRAFGADQPLTAGMRLTADIILEERSFAEWLIEPVLAARGRM